MFRKLLVVAGFAVAMAFSTGVAHADTMTVSGTTNGYSCPSCPAANYTLTVTGDFSTGTNLTVTLEINFSPTATISSGVDDYINAVAFKIGSSVVSVGGFSGPGTFSGFDINSGISNSGCSGSGGGFVCSAGSVMASQGSTLTFTWTGVNMGGPVSTDPSEWSVKVDYGPHNGYLISENTTPAPEPGTLALLGVGLIPLLGFGRRFFA
jgi:hypothetical protein